MRVYNPFVHVIDEQVKANMLRDMEGFALAALLPRTCPLFSRSRWNGADASLNWLGLFAGHYNGALFAGTIQRFVGLPLLQRPAASAEDAWMRAISAEVDQEMSRHSEGGLAAEAVDEEVLEPDAEVSGQADEWHRRNKQYRRKAVNFAAELCLGTVFVFSIVGGLLQQRRRELFHRASVVWRRNVYARAARTHSPSNFCKLLEVLASDDVQRFYRGLFRALRERQPLLESPYNTLQSRSLLFTALARAGACIHQLLVMRRAGFPMQMFRLLTDGSAGMAADIVERAQKVCMRDELTHELLSRYPTADDLCSAPCRAVLCCIAARREYDICTIECRHASTRRVSATSAQTWVRSLQHVSAAFCIKQNKLARQNVAGVQASPQGARVAASEPEPARAKQKRARSAWVAFVHEETQGRTGKKWGGDMQELSRRFHLLNDAEMERLQGLADTATEAARQQEAPGPAGLAQTREQKHARRRLRMALAPGAADDGDAAVAGSAAVSLNSVAFGLPEELAKLSQERRSAVAAAKKIAQEEQTALQVYLHQNAAPVLDLIPDSDLVQSNSVPLPETVQTAEFSPPLADMAEAGLFFHALSVVSV